MDSQVYKKANEILWKFVSDVISNIKKDSEFVCNYIREYEDIQIYPKNLKIVGDVFSKDFKDVNVEIEYYLYINYTNKINISETLKLSLDVNILDLPQNSKYNYYLNKFHKEIKKTLDSILDYLEKTSKIIKKSLSNSSLLRGHNYKIFPKLKGKYLDSYLVCVECSNNIYVSSKINLRYFNKFGNNGITLFRDNLDKELEYLEEKFKIFSVNLATMEVQKEKIKKFNNPVIINSFEPNELKIDVIQNIDKKLTEKLATYSVDLSDGYKINYEF